MRVAVLLASAGLALTLPLAASATTLAEAIATARANKPDLRAAMARTEAADARLRAAKGARLPTVSLTGEYLSGRNDLGGFFGFGASDVDPRAVRLEMTQPLFAGGGIAAGVDQARAGQEAAKAQGRQAEQDLEVSVARAFVAVRAAEAFLAASRGQVAAFEEWTRQARLRFQAGEIPKSDLELAIARLAEARAGEARAQSGHETARAHYTALVGVEPMDLSAATDGGTTLTLDEALARAEANSPMLEAAEAGVRAAVAVERAAAAQGLPSFALTARTEQMRDQFFPGYRSDAVSVGVQGRWTLFAGGRVQAARSEASAARRVAEAQRDAARAALKAQVINAWSELHAIRLAADAARDQSVAATSAVDSLRNEVRVGQRPMVDLLDAQRDLLAATARRLATEGDLVVAARRVAVLTGGPTRQASRDLTADPPG